MDTSKAAATETSVAAVEHVKVRVLPDGRLTRTDAARYIGIDPKTMANWSLTNFGPRPHRVGGRVFYYKDALDAFIRGEQPAPAAA